MDGKDNLYACCLRLGDTNLILGHRLSEMCSRAPFLEEDIALANLALDHIGQAEALLKYAGELEGRDRSEDDLAYLRPEWEFRNCLLAEQPNTDFAFVVARQFLFDVFFDLVYDELKGHVDPTMAGMAVRFSKEAAYHRRHSGAWLNRLGLGTDESRRRMQAALDAVWRYTADLFDGPAGIDWADISKKWAASVETAVERAGLRLPVGHTAAKPGIHTEHLGHILSEMQFLQRAFPGATW